MRLEYRDNGDCHLKVLEGDEGGIELRLTDKHDVEHRLKLTAERARELLTALLLVIPPRRKRWPPPLIAGRMRAMAQDTKPEPAEPAKDRHAIHESGHATVATMIGLPVRELTLDATYLYPSRSPRRSCMVSFARSVSSAMPLSATPIVPSSGRATGTATSRTS
jgi:hypothetical protein